MWTCSKCSETIEDQFDACWKCGEYKPGVTPPEAEPAVQCVRCKVDLQFAGTKSFHDGVLLSGGGEWYDMFPGSDHFNVYFCPDCGHVELFLGGKAGSPEPPEENPPKT